MSQPTLSKPHTDPLLSSRTLIIGGTSGIGLGVASAVLAAISPPSSSSPISSSSSGGSGGGKLFLSSSSPTKISSAISQLKALYPSLSSSSSNHHNSIPIIQGEAADLSCPSTIEENLKRILDSVISSSSSSSDDTTTTTTIPLDHIIYTAGDSFDFTPLSSATPQNAYDSWTVRYLGPLLLGKLISLYPGKYLSSSSSSSITLTSGIHGSKPLKGISKSIGWCGAVEGLTRALAVDLGTDQGIRVNFVSPGAIRTPMLEGLGEEAVEEFGGKSLLVGGGKNKGVGTVAEVAEGYLFCMRCSFFTGQGVVVDGGYSYK